MARASASSRVSEKLALEDFDSGNHLGTDPSFVNIQGKAEQIDKAKSLIQQLIAPEHVDRIFVPLSKVGLVIGKGGSTIQQVRTIS